MFLLFAALPPVLWLSYKNDDKEEGASAARNYYINSRPQRAGNRFVLHPSSEDVPSHETPFVQTNSPSYPPRAEPSSYVPPNVPHHASLPTTLDSGTSYVTPSAPQLAASHLVPNGLPYPPANAPVKVSTSPPLYELALAMACGPKDTPPIETKTDTTG